MIKTFKHKGLEQFFKDGNKKGINPEHAKKIARILDRLDASTSPKDMNLPGYKLHKLTGCLLGMGKRKLENNFQI